MKQRDIYKCKDGMTIEVLNGSGCAEMTCCGEPMRLLKENTTDAAQEKHVPVIEKVEGGIKVTVGSTPHPMEEDHYIEWLEVIDGARSYMHFLRPGDAPEAVFPLDNTGVTAREHCNKHGLWRTN